MFNVSPNTDVCDSNLGAEMLNSVFPVSAWGVRIDLSVPTLLLAELPAPIVPGAEFDNRGPVDAELSVQLNHSVEGDPLYEITENGKILGIETSLRGAAEAVESWAQLTVATLAKGLVFVHAGVVGWRNRAVVIPGRSLSGKSTLVLELVRAGADYYSDEYAVFDSEGRVHPYWRLPKLRAASDQKAASHLLGGILSGPPPIPIPLGCVLISRYEAESSWQPRRLTSGKTLLGLLDNTVPLRGRPEQSIKTLAKAIANAQGFEGPRGEAADFAQRALALL
jgi:hypothetical protein